MSEAQTDLRECRVCGADCSVQTFRGPHIEGEATIWMCSEHRYLGGKCHSDIAYLTRDAWNDSSEAPYQGVGAPLNHPFYGFG